MSKALVMKNDTCYTWFSILVRKETQCIMYLSMHSNSYLAKYVNKMCKKARGGKVLWKQEQ